MLVIKIKNKIKGTSAIRDPGNPISVVDVCVVLIWRIHVALPIHVSVGGGVGGGEYLYVALPTSVGGRRTATVVDERTIRPRERGNQSLVVTSYYRYVPKE